jgi:two-component system sensor histidine kinase KdpD
MVRVMRVNNMKQRAAASDALVFLLTMAAAIVLSLPLGLVRDGGVYLPMILLAAVLVTARFTTGFVYSAAASVVGALWINFSFRQPYFDFDFLYGDLVTFACMLAVALLTSRMTQQIREQEVAYAEAERERVRGNLLRAVSHDLRTPLTSILGATSAILENGETLSAERRTELIRGVYEDSEWLIRMVENLLLITKVEGAAQIVKRSEAVEEVVAEAVQKFQKHYPESLIEVSAPEDLLMVPMDALLIEQVLFNLLENAVLHGYAKHIELNVLRSGTEAILEVRDDGRGIQKADFPHLFDGYMGRVERASSDNSRNMGIGLSVCLSIIQAHGGSMEAKNVRPSGALFRFTLPMEEAPDGQ